ncbi:MAG: hypothetical protein ACPGTU_02290 [Myxococcota bacterium]
MTDTFEANQRERLDNLLSRFRRTARQGPYAYEWVHHTQGERHQTHLVFGCMVHGNEVGSLPAVVRLVQALNDGEVQFGGKVTIFIGNPEAARENRRYLEADLNRVFLNTGKSRHEDQRAQQIMPILNDADVFIDFHQTILGTAQPFYIFPWQHLGWQWARAVQSTKVWVTRDPNMTFSSGSKCTDEYVADRGRPGITVELSQKGFTDQAEQICWDTMINALKQADAEASGTDISELATQQPELSFYQTTYSEPFSNPEMTLRPGLLNFQAVQAGEKLHANGTPEITVPAPGAILFPKYPGREHGLAIDPRPNEIYRLVTPMDEHPMKLWGAD